MGIPTALPFGSYSPVSSLITLSNYNSSLFKTTNSYTLNNVGEIRGSPSNVFVGDWILDSTKVSDYEVRTTVEDGFTTSGTNGSWLALSTTRTWSVTPGNYVQLFVEIRHKTTLVVQDTATITLEATL